MSATTHLQEWLGFRSFRMRLVLMVWPAFHGVRSYVFKKTYAMAAESQKVPLEIFFNPTILSDDNLFSEFTNFLQLPLLKGGCLPAGRQVETIDLDES